MKKTIGKILLLSSILFVSCDQELLEPYIPGALVEDVAIQSSTDLQRLMNRAYTSLSPIEEIEFNSVFTDEIGIGFNNGGQGISTNFPFNLNSDSASPNGIWIRNYQTLSIVNRVIAFAGNYTPVDAADVALTNKLKAEAYVLRAYCHNQLLAYFSTNPSDMNALGVVLADQPFPTNYLGTRVSNQVIYDAIDADLDAAEALYAGITLLPTNNPLFANRYFGKAVQARSYAQRGDYPNALIAATDVINNSGLALATQDNYKNVFHTDNQPASVEVLFKLRKTIGQTATGGVWASVNATVNGSPFYEMGRSLFNLYDRSQYASATSLNVTAATGTSITISGSATVGDLVVFQSNLSSTVTAGQTYYVKSVTGSVITIANTITTPSVTTTAIDVGTLTATLPIVAKVSNSDIRLDNNLDPTAIVDFNYASSTDFLNTDKLPIRKYPGRLDSGNRVNDMKIARLSEMYLIRAEAYASQNNYTAVANEIKAIRDARFNAPQVAPVYSTPTEAWRGILEERRIEFAFEGYRFIDIKRLGALANQTILRDIKDVALYGGAPIQTLPVTDYRFTLPIPTSETNVNPGIQRNPGY